MNQDAPTTPNLNGVMATKIPFVLAPTLKPFVMSLSNHRIGWVVFHST